VQLLKDEPLALRQMAPTTFLRRLNTKNSRASVEKDELKHKLNQKKVLDFKI
jgi:hypothetical protein